MVAAPPTSAAPSSASGRPRVTIRTRLAWLYAGPFLAAMTISLLLFVALFQVRQTGPPLTPGHADNAGGGASAVPVVVDMAAGVLVLLAVALGLGWLVAGRLLRPLREITETARHISAHDLHRRLSAAGRDDELKALADTLDALFARLEAAFAAQRDFVANAAHELRTPLTATRTVVQVALADPDATADTLREACQAVVMLGDDQRRLIESLLTLAESQRGLERREPVDLAAIAEETVSARRDTASSRVAIDVTTRFEAARTAGDPDLVRSLVGNLVDNALRHNVPGGYVQVLTESVSDRARIWVRNSGPVVPAQELGRLFLPFQQLDNRRGRPGGGHGLGLAIVQAICSAHGADVRSRAPAEGGLEILVEFRPVKAEY
ncbi:HAMP domain-containing sensor histidine kinase [Catenulispora yoronensis]|uniref:histidine kinase n=1 Tax=Catenulispora yoronensis TaxID=450799 RepID=A0ABP5F1D3_9ACTN